jgi:hypothetical protein
MSVSYLEPSMQYTSTKDGAWTNDQNEANALRVLWLRFKGVHRNKGSSITWIEAIKIP